MAKMLSPDSLCHRIDLAFIAAFGSCNTAIQLLCDEEMEGRVPGVSSQVPLEGDIYRYDADRILRCHFF